MKNKYKYFKNYKTTSDAVIWRMNEQDRSIDLFDNKTLQWTPSVFTSEEDFKKYSTAKEIDCDQANNFITMKKEKFHK